MGIVSKIILERNAASEYLLSGVHVILTMMLVLKFYNIKILEIYHNNVLSYIFEHRCRMFARQLKIISWKLAYVCFMSSYFLNLSVKEKIYLNIGTNKGQRLISQINKRRCFRTMTRIVRKCRKWICIKEFWLF